MRKQTDVKNDKNVNFRVQNFAVPCKKSRTKKHVIYAQKSLGFIATPSGIKNGYAIKRLSAVNKQSSGDLIQFTVPEVPGKVLNKFSLFTARVNGNAYNTLAMQTDDGLYGVPLYWTPNLTNWPSTPPRFNCFASGMANGQNITFAGADDGLWLSLNGAAFQKTNVQCVPAEMLIFANRLFILHSDRETVFFSAGLDLTDFAAGNELAGSFCPEANLGKILGFGVYNGKVLLVRQYGFSSLDATFDPAGFNLTTLAHSYEEIIQGSAQTLGDSIIFATRGGLCRVTGGKVELLDIEVTIPEGISETPSIVYENKYYVALGDKITVIEKFFDSWSLIANTKVLAFAQVRNDEFSALAFINGTDGAVYQIEQSDTTETKTWESDWFNLTYAAGGQYLKQILVKTAYPVVLAVMNNKTVRRLALNGNNDVRCVNLNLKGDMFKIVIETGEPHADITELSAVIGFNNRGAI